MKEVELKSKEEGLPIFVDEDGDQYTHAGYMDIDELLKAIDQELKLHKLELYVGDIGSPDYFVCVKERKN